MKTVFILLEASKDPLATKTVQSLQKGSMGEGRNCHLIRK